MAKFIVQVVVGSVLAAGVAIGGAGTASAAVGVTLVQGTLTLTADVGSYAMGCSADGRITLNGSLMAPAVDCDRVEVLNFTLATGSTAANIVDLRGVKALTYPFLRAASFRSESAVTFLGTYVGDQVDVGNSPSTIDGLLGDDTITVSKGGGSVLRGGGGNDFLSGSLSSTPSSLEGGSGNDRITISGAGTARGLGGDDLIEVKTTLPVTVLGEDGNDTIRLTLGGSPTIDGGLGFDRIKTVQSIRGPKTPLKAEPVTVGAVEKLKLTYAGVATVATSIELLTARAPEQADAIPLFDFTMLQATAIELVIDSDPSFGAVPVMTTLRVPGGVWALDQAQRKVRAPGRSSFRWTEIGNRTINLSIVAA